ncbi:Uncharacterized protein BAE44_0010994 [Dichanthelium oligosanthes]|uniref:Zinc finger CCCH domain-containing protein 44 n=1 Tax=Dichanthelium oligosanthes TaxID=888268 RepID=A0A1E5VS85_9POAL|nr:Uncharacterized protein BAE44_0010994 [Dichanthelium oligosanthes]
MKNSFVHTFCQGCVAQAEFVPVLRKTKGFCSNCLRMVIMIEKNVDVDSDGEVPMTVANRTVSYKSEMHWVHKLSKAMSLTRAVLPAHQRTHGVSMQHQGAGTASHWTPERADFNDRATYEFLFKEYWEIVRDKEGITLDKLQEAYAILKRGQNCKQDPDLEKLPDEERNSDDDFVGNSDDDGEEPSSQAKLNGTAMKIKSFLKEGKSRRNGFVGWGSKELIEFLLSIGKDSSETLDQCRAAEVVKEYIRQKNLLQKDRKKLVICDDKLQSLFRKSKVKYNKIYYLLEKHIAANMISEDETLASSEDNSDSVMTKKARIACYQSSTPKRPPEINKKCLAALVHDNINLIYLRKSLVMDLLKEPDTFESKVIGCFVRIKNDPKDYSFYMNKKPYQLGQVTGIGKTSEKYKVKDIPTDVLLRISNIPDVNISMLSDEDFDEEECQDLRLLAQNESFLRYTVGDLEEKARSLRRDIMSHWIRKECQRLDRLIDKASEKGWRQEYPCCMSSFEHDEYLDKRQLLRDPSKKKLLLEVVPQVIPEIEDSKDSEVQVTTRDGNFFLKCEASIIYFFAGTNAESIVSLKRCSEEKYKGTNGTRASYLKSCAEEKFKGTSGERELSSRNLSEEKSEATNAYTNGGTAVTHTQKQGTEANNLYDIPSVQNLDAKGAEEGVDGDTARANVQRRRTEATKANTAADVPGTFVQKEGAREHGISVVWCFNPFPPSIRLVSAADVITIEDDDDDHPRERSGQTTVVDLEGDGARDTHHAQHKTNNISRRGHRNVKVDGGASQLRGMWHYTDPQGDEQGPFMMAHLHLWWNNGFFPNDFRVWRAGQTSDTAILLTDALQGID